MMVKMMMPRVMMKTRGIHTINVLNFCLIFLLLWRNVQKLLDVFHCLIHPVDHKDGDDGSSFDSDADCYFSCVGDWLQSTVMYLMMFYTTLPCLLWYAVILMTIMMAMVVVKVIIDVSFHCVDEKQSDVYLMIYQITRPYLLFLSDEVKDW